MRIHTHTADRGTIRDAMAYASNRSGRRVYAIRADEYGSRTHTTAFDVSLSGSARHRSQADRDEFAATWDEWGWFLAFLFAHDPDIKCSGVYRDADDFRNRTSVAGCPDRFAVSEWDECCVTYRDAPCDCMRHGAVKLPRNVRHAETKTVKREVRSGQRISDESAAAIASWWQSSGTVGRTFASFVSHFMVSRDDLINDAEMSLTYTTTAADKAELSALIRWAYLY
jgi:hypothetical protein